MIKDEFGFFRLEESEFLVHGLEPTAFQVQMDEINLYANDLCMKAFFSMYPGDWENHHTGKYEGMQFRAKVLTMKTALGEATEEEKQELRDFLRVHEFCFKVYENQTRLFLKLKRKRKDFDIKTVPTMDWPVWEPLK